MNPYSENNYSLWLKSFGDSDGRLELAAQYFGVHVVKQEKQKLYESKKTSLKFSTPEECKESLSVLENYVKEIGYQNFSNEKSEIIALTEKLENERKQIQYDSKRKTLDFTTANGCRQSLSVLESFALSINFTNYDKDKAHIIELADKLERQEKQSLFQQKKSSLDFSNNEVLEKNWPILEEYAISIGYQLASDEKLKMIPEMENKEKASRTVNGVLYGTVEMAREAAKVAQEAERIAREAAKAEQQRLDEIQTRTVNGKVFDTVEKAEKEKSRKKVGIILAIGFLIFPPLSFMTFMKGYSFKARIYPICILLFFLLIFVAAIFSDKDKKDKPVLTPSVVNVPPQQENKIDGGTKKNDITGTWKGNLEGEGQMDIKSSSTGFDVSLNVSAASAGGMACTGTIDGAGTLSGNTLTLVKKEEGSQTCTITIKFSDNTASVSEDNCSFFHGAACGFSGTLKKE